MKEKEDIEDIIIEEKNDESKDEEEVKKEDEKGEGKEDDEDSVDNIDSFEESIDEVEEIKIEEKEEDNKIDNNNNKENEIITENKKIITTFEYKKNIEEVSNQNIIYSDDNNNINYISLELLISKINDNTLEETNKNMIYRDILLYIVYQKNALMTTDIFFNIIESLMKSNNIETGLLLLNSYLINYYSTEILQSKDILNKVIYLYNLSNRQEIIFKLVYEQDKKIEIKQLIEYIKNEEKDKINSLGGMEIIRNENERRETIIPETIDKYFDIFSWAPIEIARQITIYTQYLYRNIGCQELISAGWTKKDKMEKSPNISKIIVRFNKISKWIMEEILSYDFSKDRSKVIEIFLYVAEELRNINNFNDCFAIITTFNHLSIKRLKRTWKKVSANSKSKQKELSKLCSILKNYESIKNEFLLYKNNVTNINEIKDGCIPYLAPYLKDLAFLEEGHKYFNENKLINLNKLIIVGKNIKNIKESQLFVYSYKPVYSLSFLSDPEPLDDKELTTLSESLEPKFKLNIKRSRMKRKTNTESTLESKKSGLSDLFIEYINDYANALQKTQTLNERIKQFKMQYTPIQLVASSNPINRSLDLSTSLEGELLRLSSKITKTISSKIFSKNSE